MDPNALTQLVSQVGFPIFVAVWLLWKGEQQNQAIVSALNDLKMAVTVLSEKIGGDESGK